MFDPKSCAVDHKQTSRIGQAEQGLPYLTVGMTGSNAAEPSVALAAAERMDSKKRPGLREPERFGSPLRDD
jgi:hypothetical protein